MVLALPPEMLLLIFSFLPDLRRCTLPQLSLGLPALLTDCQPFAPSRFVHLANCALVCRRWYHVASGIRAAHAPPHTHTWLAFDFLIVIIITNFVCVCLVDDLLWRHLDAGHYPNTLSSEIIIALWAKHPRTLTLALRSAPYHRTRAHNRTRASTRGRSTHILVANLT
jgi:hypothetical protein